MVYIKNKKLFFSILTSSILLFPFFALAQSVCKVNGKVVPCDSLFKSIAGIGIAVIAIFILIGLAALIFWLWMLIDCIRRDMDNKPVWIIVIIFAHLLGAIIYYFAVKRKAPKINSAPTQGPI